MKPQPFNLELWLHLGKPDCVWTRNGLKVEGLHYHSDSSKVVPCLSGIIIHKPLSKQLHIWFDSGQSYLNNEMFDGRDLMLHLEDKPKTPWIMKK